MYNSLKLFKCVDYSELQNLSYEEVIWIYQSSNDKRTRNKCFCYIFTDLFPLILKAFNTYQTIAGITIEEKTSLCIMRVFNSMDNYTRNMKTKFSSYLYGNICRGIMTLNTEYGASKRKTWINIINVDPLKNNDLFLENINYQNDGTASIINLKTDYVDKSKKKPEEEIEEEKKEKERRAKSFTCTVGVTKRETPKHKDIEETNLDLFIKQLDKSILNQEEVNYCKALLSGYKKPDDLCTALNYETETKFDEKKKDYVTVPTVNSKSKLNSLKRSIKDKIMKNHFSIF